MMIKYLKFIAPILLLCFVGLMGCKGIDTIQSPKTKISVDGQNNRVLVYIPVGPNGERLDDFDCEKHVEEFFPVLSKVNSVVNGDITQTIPEVVYHDQTTMIQKSPAQLPTVCMLFRQ